MAFIKKSRRNGHIYLSEVENKWVNGKCVQKHIRYIGKEVDGETKLSASISDLEIEEVKVYGPLLVLHHISKKIHLPDMLGDHANEILSMVYAHCLNYQSISNMNEWYKRTDLPVLLDLDNVTEKKLLNALDGLEKLDVEKLQHDLFEEMESIVGSNEECLVYDVTNTYFYGYQCPISKLGHDKEGVKGRPLIQIALAVTQHDGIPLFHKVFDGNIHDARTRQDLVSTVKKYRIQSSIIIYDRGTTSYINIKELNNIGLAVICGVPLWKNIKKTISSHIKKSSLVSIENRVKCNHSIFYVSIMPYKFDTVKGSLVICYNQKQANDLCESRYDEIMHAQSLVKKNKKIKHGLEKYFDENGEILKKEIIKAGEFDGFSCIFTTKNLSKEEIIRLYFDKDIVEKSFRSLKGIIHLRPIRHWLYNRVIAHVLICYLAYSLLSILKFYLRKLNLSPDSALKHLSSMYKVYLRDKEKDFKIARVVILKKIQKNILTAIDKNLVNSSGQN